MPAAARRRGGSQIALVGSVFVTQFTIARAGPAHANCVTLSRETAHLADRRLSGSGLKRRRAR